MEEFSIFKIYPDINQAQGLIQLLEAEKIQFSIIDNTHDVDVTFTGNQNQTDIQVLIHKDNFEIVNHLLEKKAEQEIDPEDTSHYLYKFTDEELLEILEKRDEWNDYDYVLAKKILTDRGQDVSPEELKKLKQKREAELAQPDEVHKYLLPAGYILSLFGGIVGILIGWSLMKSKKTLPSGEKIYRYTEEKRDQGRILFIIGFSIAISVIAVKIGLSQ